MKYIVKRTARFRKDLKRMIRRGADIGKLEAVVKALACGETLAPKHRDHALSGNLAGFRDCHVENDWVLLYTIDNGALVLVLTRTGTHSDLL